MGGALDRVVRYTGHHVMALDTRQNKLVKQGKLTDQTLVEFVLCVPVVWLIKPSCIMQLVLLEAAVKSGFIRSGNGSSINLFLISEPEAAATCILKEDSKHIFVSHLKSSAGGEQALTIKAKENIMVLDAGSGKMGAITYELKSFRLFRLSSDIVQPGSMLMLFVCFLLINY